MGLTIFYWIVLLSTFVGIYYLGAKTDLKLWARVIIALVAGAILGFIFGDLANSSKWIGDLFVRFIRMLVVPLIFTSLVAGVVSMGDPKRLGSIGVKTIALYMLTTLFAIIIGLVLGTLFKPGMGIELTGVDPFTMGSSSMSVADRLFGIANGTLWGSITYCMGCRNNGVISSPESICFDCNTLCRLSNSYHFCLWGIN